MKCVLKYGKRYLLFPVLGILCSKCKFSIKNKKKNRFFTVIISRLSHWEISNSAFAFKSMLINYFTKCFNNVKYTKNKIKCHFKSQTEINQNVICSKI